MLVLGGGMWGCTKENKCFRCFRRCCHETNQGTWAWLCSVYLCLAVPEPVQPLQWLSPGKFPSPPSLPALVLALLLTGPCSLETWWGGLPPPWKESAQPLPPCKIDFFSPVCHIGDTGIPCAATAGLCFPSSGKVIHSNQTALNVAKSLSWLQAIKISMQMRRQIAYLLSSGWAVNWKDQLCLSRVRGSRSRGKGNELATAPNWAHLLLIQPGLEAELQSCLLRRFVILMEDNTAVVLNGKAEGKTIFYSWVKALSQG